MALRKFYTDQEILITGGSGFIGKSLIEKILRSLPNVGKIYVLLRIKKGKSPNERFQEILDSEVFDRAREEQPDAFKKIVIIAGDCKEVGLGISAEDLEKIKNVTMIFHSAASVRFDDHLKCAILQNTRGTHELVKIAENMPKLKAFIHVSTTYAYPTYSTLEEKIYPPYADWRTSIKLAETCDIETLNILFPKYSDFQPNSYTFTKSLSEHIINDYRHKLPLMVFRPSIVIHSVEEPCPGYIDNFNGPVGMLIACGIGIMRTHLAQPDTIADFIPVDICSRAILVAGYKLANEQDLQDVPLKTPSQSKDHVNVINCTNSSMSVLTNQAVIALGKDVVADNPFEKTIWLPDGDITRCVFWHYIRFISLQIIPSIILDCFIRMSNHPPILMKLQRRIYSTCAILNIYLNTQWTFINENLKHLDTLLNEEELAIFGVFIYVGYDQRKFVTNSVIGAKRFLLHEPLMATPQVRLRVHILKILHYFFQFLGLYYIIRYLVSYAYSYLNSMLDV